MINVDDRMILAVPKKGRLSEPSIEYLRRIGLSFRRKDRHDIALSSNMEIAIIFLPAKDIPLYVGAGRVDLAITGEDIVFEAGLEKEIDIRLKLGFGKCVLSLAVPKNSDLTSKDFSGKNVVTSFPNLTSKFFKDTGINDVNVKTVSGSVEIACSLGAAHGITDLVQSGETIKEAGLKVINDIMPTEAVLISRKKSSYMDLIEKLTDRIKGVVFADEYAMIEYNIDRKNLEKGIEITPGLKSPTVMPLEDENWVAVKSAIKRKHANELMDRLKGIGACDILITLMDNCRI